jgi:hypothetical protein
VGAVRLRQAVLAAAELEPVAERLRAELGLGEPYADPGVALFGLHNAVFALGDQFLEVIAPTQPDTAAGRWLQRRGCGGGYMLIFQLEDLEGARARAAQRGVRVAWEADLPDISATHLHPADTRGALVSIDRPDPPESWRWGGPQWTGVAGTGAPGALTGVTVQTADPEAVAELWGFILGVAPAGPRLRLDDATVAFERGAEHVAAIDVALPDAVRRGRRATSVGGVELRLAG